MEESIISESGRSYLSPSRRKTLEILEKKATNIQTVTYQRAGSSETTRELTW